jgi:hypothetical protein
MSKIIFVVMKQSLKTIKEFNQIIPKIIQINKLNYNSLSHSAILSKFLQNHYENKVVSGVGIIKELSSYFNYFWVETVKPVEGQVQFIPCEELFSQYKTEFTLKIDSELENLAESEEEIKAEEAMKNAFNTINKNGKVADLLIHLQADEADGLFWQKALFELEMESKRIGFPCKLKSL